MASWATRKGKRTLFVVGLLTLAVSPAEAFYLDFSDLHGATGGNPVQIEFQAQTISFSPRIAGSRPVSIGRAGLGVGCVGSSRQCRGNPANGTDRRWNRAVRIVFEGASVPVDAVGLTRFGGRDRGAHEVEPGTGVVSGRGRSQEIEGFVTRQLTMTGADHRSAGVLRGLEISLIRPQSPRPGLAATGANPVPEPTAALLFAAGLGIASIQVRPR